MARSVARGFHARDHIRAICSRAPLPVSMMFGRTDLLRFINARRGVYGNEIPDDDYTTESLTWLVEQGLLRSEPARLDDYFYLTKAGKRALTRTR